MVFRFRKAAGATFMSSGEWCMCSAFRKIFLLLACCTACFNIFAAPAFARTGMHHGGPDSPHNTTNGISCDSCHSLTSTDPKLILDDLDFGTNIDDTRYNSLCWSCHVSGGDAPFVRNHSSLNTSDRYGNWTVECWVCHSQHAQEEINLYPDALLYSGIADNVVVTAATVTVTDNDANWPIASDDSLVGMRIIPNTLDDALRHWNYKIVSNTATTLTVERLSDTSDTSAFQISNTFGIYLGKLMPEYLRLVWITNPGEEKSGKPYPKLFRREGTNSYADGDTVYDGICEVCHTMTNHFRNDGSAPDQLHGNLTEQPVAGTNCIRCHRHENGFAHSGGPGTGCVACHGHDAGSSYDPDMTGGLDLSGTDHPGYGTAQSHSTHTESNAIFGSAYDDDRKGPGIYCDTCHLIDSIPFFKSGTDANGDGRFDLNETDVCDACHSKGGTYNGVADPVFGAKKIWQTGAYVATDDSTLRSDKEKWCAGCHDEEPSNSKADGSGVIAPNVIGDEDGPYAYGTGWGYYKNGHGLARGVYPASGAPAAKQPCSGCHDYSTSHIDGDHRTYLAASDNYQAGYRLAYNMDIPRSDLGQPVSDFALCFACHDSDPYINSANSFTNFREGAAGNSHYLHLQSPSSGQFSGSDWWDSDWDGATGDSKFSCPACHNVHGSPSPRMMRHGELISTSGTTDKVPALNFKYTPASSYPTLKDSTGGMLNPPTSAGGTIGNSGVCKMCHSNQESYIRTPNDMYLPEITDVYGKVGSNILMVIFSEGVYTDTGAVGALATGDFVFTDADDSRTLSGVTHSAGDDFAVLTLSTALDATDDIGVDTLAAATAASIYDAASQAMNTSQVVVSGDATAPILASQNPANDATEIAVNSNLTFTLSDSGTGVDWSTFQIQLTGNLGYAKTYTDTDTSVVAKSGNMASYAVTVNPDLNFSNNEIITVTVNVSDYVGNALAPPAWSFTTQVVSTPQTMIIHPSGLAAEGSGGFVPSGGGWADVLDNDDGDLTNVNKNATMGTFYVDMDDPDISGATINSVTVKGVVRNTTSGNINIGYKTGTSIIWKGNTSVGSSYTTLTLTAPTDSDGGAWSLSDLESLRVAVQRNYTGSSYCYATEVSVEINYTP